MGIEGRAKTPDINVGRGEEFDAHARRRLKNEARLTSGIGKSKKKERTLEIFWNHVWPKLEKAGWTKHEGTASRDGSITFLPKGNNLGERAEGTYYERIRDVLDRLQEGRTQTEATIFSLYLSLHEQLSAKKANAKCPRRTSSNRSKLVSSKVDLSWKDGGRNFPRKKSRVGADYQVSQLPLAGTFESSEVPECVIMWDPKKASILVDANGNLPLLANANFNLREAALILFAECNYEPGEDFLEVLSASPAPNGSDWPPEKRAKFSELAYTLRKDMHGICSNMNINMATCLAYYYSIFKHTDDYRLVKTILQDEKADAKASKMQSMESGQADSCLICGDGGELLICDGCEGEYHMNCMEPALAAVPEGRWECDECVNKKLLELRHYLVRRSGIVEANFTDQADEPVVLRPTPAALASVRKMALGISKLLMPDNF